MKRILMILMAIILLSGCTATIEENKATYNKITAEEAKETMDNEDVIILDVRTPEEYEESHIERALLIPVYDIENLAESEIPNKDEKILLYCKSGSRSKSAAEQLIDMGYTDVNDFGGIIDWPYETVRGE